MSFCYYLRLPTVNNLLDSANIIGIAIHGVKFEGLGALGERFVSALQRYIDVTNNWESADTSV